MPLWSVEEWRVRIACSYSALGVWRPIKLRGYGGRIKSRRFVSSYPDRRYLSSFVETCWQKLSSAAFMFLLFLMVDFSDMISLSYLGKWAGKVVGSLKTNRLTVPLLKCVLLVLSYFKGSLLHIGAIMSTTDYEMDLDIPEEQSIDTESMLNVYMITRSHLKFLCWQNLFSSVVMVILVAMIDLRNILAFPCWGEWQTRVVVPQRTHLLIEVSLKCVMVTLSYLKLLLLLSGDIETNPGPAYVGSTATVYKMENSDSDRLASMAFLLVVMATLLLESGNVEQNPGPVEIYESDWAEVMKYLLPLDDNQIKLLGGFLGLSAANLGQMRDLPADMVRAWLRGEEMVMMKCGQQLTWEVLAQKLREMKPPQTNIAAKILKERCTQGLSDRDWSEIVRYLNKLDENQIRRLGGELGLSVFSLENMHTLPDDMVKAWLRKEEKVIEMCGKHLKWEHLVEALHKIGQESIADTIRKEKCGENQLDLPLTLDDHHAVLCAILQLHATKWREIGLHLGFLPGQLDIIQATPSLLQTAPVSWMNAMLERFLTERDSGAMMSVVETALRKAGLGVTATQLRDDVQLLLDTEDEDRRHYEAYQQALQTGVSVPIKFLKLVMFGPPRVGKTSLKRRLIGEIINLLGQATQPSTGTVDAHNVKLTEEKMTSLAAAISETTWRAVGHGEEKTDLDEELHLLYQFITEGSVGLTSTVSDEPQPSASKSVQDLVKETQENINSLEDLPDTLSKSKPSDSQKALATNSTVTEEQSMVVGHHTEPDPELKEIERALEAFDIALKSRAGRQQLKVLLEKTIHLNMVDTGGHPAFIEMLPMLTIGPALYLIFLRLDQELKQRYKIQYVREDNEEVSLGESSYTFQEVIFQVLSSIACSRSDTSTTTSVPDKPQITSQQSQAAMLVGTYKDKLEGSPEEVQSKIIQIDRALQEELKDVLDTDLFEADRNLLRYASEDQLMFDVDNMTGGEDEVQKIRKRLEEVIFQEFNEVPIPASWLMFGLFLRRMGKHTISLSHCEEIGRRLHVNDVREAILFFHHCVGVLMYYPDVEELKDMVISDPQIVFDSITELILNTFKFEAVRKAASDKFKQAGQFSFNDIEKLSKTLKSGILPLPQLVKLLEHLYIIARISYQDEVLTDLLDNVYFMPAVLRSAEESELNVSHSPVDPAPLLIRFKSGFVPVGHFCAIIANLVARRNLGWILMEPQQSGSYTLYKNRVTFRVYMQGVSYDVILISKAKQYEVHITLVRSPSSQPSHKHYKHILEAVCHTLDHVISKMKHKQYLALSSSNSPIQSPYELGFQCPLHPDEDHMAVCRPQSVVMDSSLSTAQLMFECLKNNAGLLCLKENIYVTLREGDNIEGKYGLWMDVDSLQTVINEDVDLPLLCELVSVLVPNYHKYWRQIGRDLQLPDSDLDKILVSDTSKQQNQLCLVIDCWFGNSSDKKPATLEELDNVLQTAPVEVAITDLELQWEIFNSGDKFSSDSLQLIQYVTRTGTIEYFSIVDEIKNWKEIDEKLHTQLNGQLYTGWPTGHPKYPRNWKGLYNLLRDFDHKDVARKLTEAVSARQSTVQDKHFFEHYQFERYQVALKEGGIKLKYYKMLFLGLPGAGKTSMKRRLIGEIVNLTPKDGSQELPHPSTTLAKLQDVMITPTETNDLEEVPSSDTMSNLEPVITSTTTVAICNKSHKWLCVVSCDELGNKSHGKEALKVNAHHVSEFFFRLMAKHLSSRSKEGEAKSTKKDENKFEGGSKAAVHNYSLGLSVKTDHKREDAVAKRVSVDSKPTVTAVHKLSSAKDTKQNTATHAESGANKSKPQLTKNEDTVIDPKIISVLDEFNSTLKESQPQKELLDLKLEDTIFVQIVDTGGQSAFLELLPMLTVGPALYLVFFKLNKDLNARYDDTFRGKTKQESLSTGESALTIREVIQQTVSSVVCFKSFSESIPTSIEQIDTDLKQLISKQKQAVVLFGTHKDILDKLPKKDRENKLKNFRDVLTRDVTIFPTLPERDKDPVKWYKPKQELFMSVSNMTGDEKEIEQIQVFLKERLDDFHSLPIPSSWFMFSLFLRKLDRDTLRMNECKVIAERFEVKNLKLALWFLHRFVGIPLHYHDEGELDDLVICNPQVVFDSISVIIIEGLKKSCQPDHFESHGMFLFRYIQESFDKRMEGQDRMTKKTSCITPLQLVQILLLHNFIGLVESGGRMLSKEGGTDSKRRLVIYENDKYFMPSRLPFASEGELTVKCKPTDPAPLIVTFKCGFMPVGVFCATIAYIVSKEKTWHLLSEQRRNKITFRIDGIYDVTLISKPKWYEIHVVSINTSTRPACVTVIAKICRKVRTTYCQALDHVVGKMENVTKILNSSSDSNSDHYQLGFYCPMHPGSDHIVVCTPSSNIGDSPKMEAKTKKDKPRLSTEKLWLSDKSYMKCSNGKDPIRVELSEYRLNQFRYQSWFQKDTPQPLPDSTTSSESDDVTISFSSQPIFGQEFVLNCNLKIESDYPDWVKDRKIKYQWQKVGSTEELSNTKELNFPSICVDDAGKYQCTVTIRDSGQDIIETSETFYLKELEIPAPTVKVVSSPGCTVSYGDPVTLTSTIEWNRCDYDLFKDVVEAVRVEWNGLSDTKEANFKESNSDVVVYTSVHTITSVKSCTKCCCEVIVCPKQSSQQSVIVKCEKTSATIDLSVNQPDEPPSPPPNAGQPPIDVPIKETEWAEMAVKYWSKLDLTKAKRLGGVLGLGMFTLQNKGIDDIIMEWKRKADNVVEKYKGRDPHTWNVLYEALKEIKQNGVAQEVYEDKLSVRPTQKNSQLPGGLEQAVGVRVRQENLNQPDELPNPPPNAGQPPIVHLDENHAESTTNLKLEANPVAAKSGNIHADHNLKGLSLKMSLSAFIEWLKREHQILDRDCKILEANGINVAAFALLEKGDLEKIGISFGGIKILNHLLPVVKNLMDVP